MNHQSLPPVLPVKPSGRKLVRMLGFGRDAEEQGFPSHGSGALEISGILEDWEKKRRIAPPHAFFFTDQGLTCHPDLEINCQIS